MFVCVCVLVHRPAAVRACVGRRLVLASPSTALRSGVEKSLSENLLIKRLSNVEDVMCGFFVFLQVVFMKFLKF